MAGDLFHKTSQNKVQLGIYFIENAEIRYGWVWPTVITRPDILPPQEKTRRVTFLSNNVFS